MNFQGLSKSRIFLIGVGAVVAIAIVAGAVFAFMSSTKSDTVAKDVPKGSADVRSESAELISREQLEKDVNGIGAAVQKEKALQNAAKEAVNDEQKRVKVIN